MSYIEDEKKKPVKPIMASSPEARALSLSVASAQQAELNNGKPKLKDQFNVFATAFDATNSISRHRSDRIETFLNRDGKVAESLLVTDVRPPVPTSADLPSLHPTANIRCFASTAGVEKMRDLIKEALWNARLEPADKTVSVRDLTAGKPATNRPTDVVSRVGTFLSKKGKNSRVSQEIFKFPFYHTKVRYPFLLNVEKLDAVPKKCSAFLETIAPQCPNHLFSQGDRASKVKLEISKPSMLSSHSLIDIAKEVRNLKPEEWRKSANRHPLVLGECVSNSSSSGFAAEVPVWMECGELRDYGRFIGPSRVLTGHIDLLCSEEDGRIGVWDFKPNAFNERFAATQVFLYALMLSVRTRIPLTKFRCGYFDCSDAFSFHAEEFPYPENAIFAE